MKVFCVFAAALLLMALAACHCHNRICGNFNSLSPVFIGYDTADADTVLLVRYERNDTFQTALDTLLLDSLSGNIRFAHDTAFVTIPSDSFKINGDYDWEIILPSINGVTRIYDIAFEIRKYYSCETDDPGCINRILGFTQNGTHYSGLYEYRYCYIHH
ncbi:MAG: hypothetical protein U0V74_11525 [Chitinophagales bacterium]